MHEGFLKDIEAVDLRVVAKDATSLYLEELHRQGASGPFVAQMEEDARREKTAAPGGESLDTLLKEADFGFGCILFPKDLAARSPKLKWFHIGGVGLDNCLDADVFDGRVTVTNSSGAIAVPIAEHVMGYMFMLAKNALRLCRDKTEHRWERFQTIELNGKTVGIVGMGAIGTEIARMAKGIGMRVLATRRSATRRERGVGYVDELYGYDELTEMLGASDFVALALPLTPESRDLIGERELRVMKPSAFIVNISRGEIIDEAMLVRALREGWIAGAGLDVTTMEPLPPNSDLWDLPNVFISGHMAGSTDQRPHWVSRLFCDNLKKYISGEPLRNVVTRERGY